MKTTKGCGQMSSNKNFFAEIWFSGVKTEEEINAEGVEYCRPVEKIPEEFLLATLGKSNKMMVGGVSSCYEKFSKSSW